MGLVTCPVLTHHSLYLIISFPFFTLIISVRVENGLLSFFSCPFVIGDSFAAILTVVDVVVAFKSFSFAMLEAWSHHKTFKHKTVFQISDAISLPRSFCFLFCLFVCCYFASAFRKIVMFFSFLFILILIFRTIVPRYWENTLSQMLFQLFVFLQTSNSSSVDFGFSFSLVRYSLAFPPFVWGFDINISFFCRLHLWVSWIRIKLLANYDAISNHTNVEFIPNIFTDIGTSAIAIAIFIATAALMYTVPKKFIELSKRIPANARTISLIHAQQQQQSFLNFYFMYETKPCWL